MKKLIILLSVVTIISCKKETTISKATNCRFLRVIHHSNGDIDTSVYSYSGEDASYTSTYSYTSNISTVNYIKSGAQYLYKSYSNGIQKFDGFDALNAQGLFDTTRITNLSTTLSTSAKYSYDANNNLTRYIGYYNGYTNDIKYFYSNGNYSYLIYNYYDLITPANSTKDSVVSEYYLDKPKLAERYIFDKKIGNLEKNLVKKRLYYNLLSGNTLRKTYDYEYQTDANGLVTREIWTTKIQPGEIVQRIDTTYFEYVCN